MKINLHPAPAAPGKAAPPASFPCSNPVAAAWTLDGCWDDLLTHD